MNKYILALLKCKNIGNVKLLKYIQQNSFNHEKIKNNIQTLVSKEDYERINEFLTAAEEEITSNESKGIKLITILDEKFPKKLYDIKDPVLYLYYIGNINLINKPSLAIIGSREIEDNEKNISKNLASYFSNQEICIVSGLAIGTDTFAHKGAIKGNGKTIAILPSGLDNIVPTSNKELAKEILNNNGLLVSEYSIGTNPSKYTFVKRDRIQSALSNAILVIKASETSGTMHAVKAAFESNKYVTQIKGNNNKHILNNFEINKDENRLLEIINNTNNSVIEEPIIEQTSLF